MRPYDAIPHGQRPSRTSAAVPQQGERPALVVVRALVVESNEVDETVTDVVDNAVTAVAVAAEAETGIVAEVRGAREPARKDDEIELLRFHLRERDVVDRLASATANRPPPTGGD